MDDEWVRDTGRLIWTRGEAAETPPLAETYEVEIIDTATGERRTAKETTPWHEHTLGWWTDGNFGCDCNRGMEFDEAGGDERDEHPCNVGPNRYRVTFATLPDGCRIEIDGEPPGDTAAS